MEFQGDYLFLSNFYPSPVYMDGEKYRTVEHAYQAAKALGKEAQRAIREAPTPADAKILGRKVPLLPGWDDGKVFVMWQLLKQKFASPPLAEMLVALEEEIVEDNTWGDTFWGKVDGVGLNWLGRLLSTLRGEIINERQRQLDEGGASFNQTGQGPRQEIQAL